MNVPAFCSRMNTRLMTSRKMFGRIGCWCLLTLVKASGRKFFLPIEYSMRTVDIQKPRMEAVMPIRMETRP